MKVWHVAALLLGVGIIMVLIRNMQISKAQLSTGATSNDVILGLSKFGSGLLSLGGKIFTPSAASSDGGNDPSYGPDNDYKYTNGQGSGTYSWGDSSNTG